MSMPTLQIMDLGSERLNNFHTPFSISIPCTWFSMSDKEGV